MQKPQGQKLIGITGGIGSGKTTVCKIFETLGIKVFNADQEAKRLVNSDQDLIHEVKSLFGKDAYINSKYNSKFVAKKVFENQDLLLKLNQLIHPKVRFEAKKWLEKQPKAPYYLYEAALMNAAGDGNTFNQIIVITAPMADRIKRIMERDGRSQAEVEAIMSKQKTDAERQKIANYEILNDSKTSLISQVMNIHQDLIAK